MSPDEGSVAQVEIELILMRQLASHLVLPVFIVDREGALVFYNEAAQFLLGVSYEEAGEMPASEWATRFQPRLENGEPAAPDQLPLVVAVREKRATHLPALLVMGSDGVEHKIAITAFPLIGQHGRELGAAALFWEV